MDYEELPDIDFSISAEPEVALQANRELNLARRIIEQTGASLFLTGKAGTGKTTFLKHLCDTCAKRMVVLAPTGVAAINAEGVTLHSFFQLPFDPYIPGSGFKGESRKRYGFSKSKRRLICSLDLIVIDEISMVRPDTLDAIDELLRRFRNPSMPFGGVQLLMIGDLRQLAPVVRDQEWNDLSPHYASPYFFESHALKRSGFLTVELQTVYRQQDNDFIAMLNNVRDGRDTVNTLSLLNRRYNPNPDSSLWGNAITLTTHNNISNRTNLLRLSALPGEERQFHAVVQGTFPENAYPADNTLTLKRGARVMFIKNATGSEREYFNGMLGTVTAFGAESVYVRPDNGDSEIEIGPVEWENTRYVIDESSKEIMKEVEGTFAQIPLRLAWSITIHKSQGLTFDKAIIDASRSFAPGQLYVALSRCRSIDGMTLSSLLPPSAVMIDGAINEFSASSDRTPPDDTRFATLRDEYYRTSLRDLFYFEDLRISFNDFARAVEEFVAPIQNRLYELFSNARKAMDAEICEVGNRFIKLYTTSRLDSGLAETNEEFNRKIMNGCSYFIDKLQPILSLAGDQLHVKLDNAKYQTRLTNSLENFMFRAVVKFNTLRRMSEVCFSPGAYLTAKSKASLEVDSDPVFSRKKKEKTRSKAERRSPKGKSRTGYTGATSTEAGYQQPEAKKSKSKVKKETKPKGYSQAETLRMFKSGMSMEAIAAERGLTLSTIVNHIGDNINSGLLKLENVVSPQTCEKMERLLARASEITSYQSLKEKAGSTLTDHETNLLYKILKFQNS